MMYGRKTLNLVRHELSESMALWHTLAYSLLGFFVPFLMGHPQWLVGITVNAALILTALSLKDHKVLPVVLLPSIAVLFRGMIFGPFTIFIAYLVPFIWLGNGALVVMFKWLNVKLRLNYFATLVLSAGVKAGLLFGATFILYKAGLVPAILLPAMGAMQFATAIGGGLVAWGAIKAFKKPLFANA